MREREETSTRIGFDFYLRNMPQARLEKAFVSKFLFAFAVRSCEQIFASPFLAHQRDLDSEKGAQSTSTPTGDSPHKIQRVKKLSTY